MEHQYNLSKPPNQVSETDCQAQPHIGIFAKKH